MARELLGKWKYDGNRVKVNYFNLSKRRIKKQNGDLDCFENPYRIELVNDGKYIVRLGTTAFPDEGLMSDLKNVLREQARSSIDPNITRDTLVDKLRDWEDL